VKKLIWMGLAALAVVVGTVAIAPIYSRLQSPSPHPAAQAISKNEELSSLNARLMPANASPGERQWMNCLMSNETNLDDRQSDASTIAQAIAGACQGQYAQAFPRLADGGITNQMPMAVAVVLAERKVHRR
jgi:hypothetical protein